MSRGVVSARAQHLERALLFTIVAHAAAMIFMALILLPGMPGGGSADDAARVAYIAASPWRWRLGWLPWQLTALSDVLLAIALLRTRWIPRLPAVVGMLVTLVAVLIEQPGEWRWITEGVTLAQRAVAEGDPAAYLRFEQKTYVRVAGWAALMYTVAACCWTWCFVAARVWSRALSWLSVATWGVLMLVSVAPLLPADDRPAPALIAAGNALGFALLMLWLALVTELVLRRARPDATHGRLAPWRAPRRGPRAWLLEVLANSRLARAFGELLPSPAFVSDIRDVIYVCYLVEAERLERFVPAGLELQRLGTAGHYALFTHLTYQHGHFGPRLLGPLRRLMPSPVQSNWRIHVYDPRTGHRGIYFVSTAISSVLTALPARLLAEGLPMHVVERGEIRTADGSFQVCLDPGTGSAPDLAMQLRPAPAPVLAAPWSAAFDTFEAMLEYCVPQDRAMSSQPWYGRITRQEIQLNIPLAACAPLAGTVSSRAAEAIVGEAAPLCFHVPRVSFRFDLEAYDPHPPSS